MCFSVVIVLTSCCSSFPVTYFTLSCSLLSSYLVSCLISGLLVSYYLLFCLALVLTSYFHLSRTTTCLHFSLFLFYYPVFPVSCVVFLFVSLYCFLIHEFLPFLTLLLLLCFPFLISFAALSSASLSRISSIHVLSVLSRYFSRSLFLFRLSYLSPFLFNPAFLYCFIMIVVCFFLYFSSVYCSLFFSFLFLSFLPFYHSSFSFSSSFCLAFLIVFSLCLSCVFVFLPLSFLSFVLSGFLFLVVYFLLFYLVPRCYSLFIFTLFPTLLYTAFRSLLSLVVFCFLYILLFFPHASLLLAVCVPLSHFSSAL